MTNRARDFGLDTVEPAVGEVVALRTFQLADDGALLPVAYTGGPAWVEGENVAACQVDPESLVHVAPETSCTCGFYAYGHQQWVDGVTYDNFRHIMGVVECYGRIVAGEKGMRAQKARLTALWLSPEVSDDIVARVQDRYPSVAIYRDRERMLAEHPTTRLDTYLPEPPAQGSRWYTSRWVMGMVGVVVGALPFLPGGWLLGGLFPLWMVGITLWGLCVFRFGWERQTRALLATIRAMNLAYPAMFLTFGCLQIIRGFFVDESSARWLAWAAGGTALYFGYTFWRRNNPRGKFTPVPGTGPLENVQEEGAGPMRLVRETPVMVYHRTPFRHAPVLHHTLPTRLYQGTGPGMVVAVDAHDCTLDRARAYAPQVLATLGYPQEVRGVLFVATPMTVYVPVKQGICGAPTRVIRAGAACRLLGLPEHDLPLPEYAEYDTAQWDASLLRDAVKDVDSLRQNPAVVATVEHAYAALTHRQEARAAHLMRAADLTPGIIPEPVPVPDVPAETLAQGWATLNAAPPLQALPRDVVLHTFSALPEEVRQDIAAHQTDIPHPTE